MEQNAPYATIDGFGPPEGFKVGWHVTRDKVGLRYMSWGEDVARARAGHCRGTMVLTHGRTEFIEKYYEVVDELLSRGFAVFTFDWRGQGLSWRPLEDRFKGHVRDFKDHVEDMREMLDVHVTPNFPGPYFSMSHSMGGHANLRIAHDLPDAFEAMIFSAPMWGIQLGSGVILALTLAIARLNLMLGRAESYVLGGAEQGISDEPFEGNKVTNDPGRFKRCMDLLRTMPDLGLGAPTYEFLNVSLASMGMTQHADYLRDIRTPLLVACGTEEKIVNNATISEMMPHLANGELVMVPDAQHEILMEKDGARAVFWAAFDGFMKGR